jgi:3-phenylpropionate/trans-cinnamate dioxygenase ferredoxin component
MRAEASRNREIWIMTKQYVSVTRESEVPEGEVRVYEVGGTRIAVARVAGKLYAIEDVCTHDDGPLGEGYMEGHEIECPRHGARFDVRTGAVCRMPAAAPVLSFPIKIENGNVLVEIEAD